MIDMEWKEFCKGSSSVKRFGRSDLGRNLDFSLQGITWWAQTDFWAR